MALENLSGQPHDHDAAGGRVRRGFIAVRDMRIPACLCTDENPDNTPTNHREVPVVNEVTPVHCTVLAGDLQTAVTVLEALNPFLDRSNERWLDRLKDVLP